MPDAQILPALPLFPLSTVLFPQGTLNLRIFEVRYLDMIRKCERAGAPFGVVALQSGTEVRRAGAAAEELFSEGTLATIEELHEAQPGLLMVQCRGTERFALNDSATLLPHGLWVGDARLLPPEPSVPVPEHLRTIATTLAQMLMQAPQVAGLPQAEQLQDCAWVAHRWAELLPMATPVKQQLLTLDSPLLRLELVGDMLDQLGVVPRRGD